MAKRKHFFVRLAILSALTATVFPLTSFAEETELEAVSKAVAEQKPTTAIVTGKEALEAQGKLEAMRQGLRGKIAALQKNLEEARKNLQVRADARGELAGRVFFPRHDVEKNGKDIIFRMAEGEQAKARMEELRHQEARLKARLENAEIFENAGKEMSVSEAWQDYQKKFTEPKNKLEKLTSKGGAEVPFAFTSSSAEERLKRAIEHGMPKPLARKYAEAKSFSDAEKYLNQAIEELRADHEIAWENLSRAQDKIAPASAKSGHNFDHVVEKLKSDAKVELSKVETQIAHRNRQLLETSRLFAEIDELLLKADFTQPGTAEALHKKLDNLQGSFWVKEEDIAFRRGVVKLQNRMAMSEIAWSEAAKQVADIEKELGQHAQALKALQEAPAVKAVASVAAAEGCGTIPTKSVRITGEMMDEVKRAKNALAPEQKVKAAEEIVVKRGCGSTLKRAAIGAGLVGTGFMFWHYSDQIREAYRAYTGTGVRKAPEIKDTEPSTVAPSSASQSRSGD